MKLNETFKASSPQIPTKFQRHVGSVQKLHDILVTVIGFIKRLLYRLAIMLIYLHSIIKISQGFLAKTHVKRGSEPGAELFHSHPSTRSRL